MQSEFYLCISLINEDLEQEGFDIRCNSKPSIEFSILLDALCKSYFVDDTKFDLLYFMFELYIKSACHKLIDIDLSYDDIKNMRISMAVFWEFVSCINLDVTKLSVILEDSNGCLPLENHIESFMIDYCVHLLSNDTEKHYVQLYDILNKIKNMSSNRSFHFRNLFLKLGPHLLCHIKKRTDKDGCKLCHSNIESDLCREIVLVSLSFLSGDMDTDDESQNNMFFSKWNIPRVSPSVGYIGNVYSKLNKDSTVTHDKQTTLFDDDNQCILAVLDLCVNLNMHKHLNEESFDIQNGADSEIINAYHMARSSSILNRILCTVLDPANTVSLATLSHNLTVDKLKKSLRRLLKAVTKHLKTHFYSVFTDELLHTDFLIWCLRSDVCVREIFLWYVDSKLYESQVEDKFLTCFNDLVGTISEPCLLTKLAERICAVNERNMPISRYIKLLKLIIYNMDPIMKQSSLTQVSELHASRALCSPVSFEATLRRCCNQLSCDVDNAAEIQLDIEYLLFLKPVVVLTELINNQCVKSGLKDSVQKVLEKISYCFDVVVDEGQMVLTKVIETLFFRPDDINDKVHNFKKLSDQIRDCLSHVFSLVTNKSIISATFAQLVVTHLDIDDRHCGSAYTLLLVLLSKADLHHSEFSSQFSAILIKLAHSHSTVYRDGNCNSSEVSVIEACMEMIIENLSAELDFDFIEAIIDSMPFCPTKLLLWSLLHGRHIGLNVPLRRCRFLSTEVLKKYSVTQTFDDKGEDHISDLVNDFGDVLLLCSTSQLLLDIVKESAVSVLDWRKLEYSHVLTIMFEMVHRCTSDGWIRILDMLQFCLEKKLVPWFYRSRSSTCPMVDISEYVSSLNLLSLVHGLLDLSETMHDNVWFSKFVKLLVNSLPILTPKKLSEQHSYSPDTSFVQVETLLHYLQMCEALEPRSDYGLKSLVLFVQPILASVASYVDDIPSDVKSMLHHLAPYERLLL